MPIDVEDYIVKLQEWRGSVDEVLKAIPPLQQKIEQLEAFKWKVIGGAIVAAAIVNILGLVIQFWKG